MSVSSIGSGSNAISDLLHQRRQSLQAMDAAIQSDDLVSAQQSLASVQSDTSSLESTSPSTSQPANPYRSTLATDLTGLSSALASGQTDQAQAALAKVQTDLSGDGTATQGTQGTHHGGHHHHGGGGGATVSASQQAADALIGSASTSTSATAAASIGSDPASASGDVLSQLLASLGSATQS